MNSVYIYFVSFLIYTPIAFVFINTIYPGIDLYISALIVLTVYFNFTSLIPYSIWSGINNFKTPFNLFFLIRIILLLVVFMLSLLYINHLFYFLFVLMISTLINFSLQLYLTNKLLNVKFIQIFLTKNIFKILRITTPLYFAVVFNFIYDKIDLLIISKMLNFEDVSFYSVGYSLFKSSTLAFGFFLMGGFSRISYFSNNKKAIKLLLKKYTLIILIITIPISVLFYLFADITIIKLYGSKFQNSVIILKILSLAIVVVGLNNLTGNVLNGLGKYKENMYITLSGLLFNIIFNILFISAYGVVAAAITTVFTELIILLGDSIVLKNYFNKYAL